MKKLISISIAILLFSSASAQGFEPNGKQINSVQKTDSLINEFQNTLYNKIYHPKFWKKVSNPTFTYLKIDIDSGGRVNNIRFSDSADSSFVNTYMRMPNYHDDKSTLEKYAKAKMYKNISIIIPVNYEPHFARDYKFSYDRMDSLMMFNKKNFSGQAIILETINIKVSADHNM